MVHRERNLRRIRSRVVISDEDDPHSDGSTLDRIRQIRSTVKRKLTSTRSTATDATPMPLQPPPVLMTNAMPAPSFGSEGGLLHAPPTRREVVERRIREISATQAPIRDPDVINGRQKSRWRKAFSKAFPGF